MITYKSFIIFLFHIFSVLALVLFVLWGGLRGLESFMHSNESFHFSFYDCTPKNSRKIKNIIEEEFPVGASALKLEKFLLKAGINGDAPIRDNERFTNPDYRYTHSWKYNFGFIGLRQWKIMLSFDDEYQIKEMSFLCGFVEL